MLYSVDKTEILSLGLSISVNSEKLLWSHKEEARVYRGFGNKDWVVRTSKDYLLLQEHQICQAKKFSAFLCMGSHKDRAPWNHSLDGHLSSLGSCLGPVSCVFSSCISSVAAVWWLLDSRYSLFLPDFCQDSLANCCRCLQSLVTATSFVYWYGREYFISQNWSWIFFIVIVTC